jgi:DNA-binding NarL/FixJ family response regulator
MKPQIRVVIADDHTIVRDGYASILKKDASMKVVAQAANGKELLDILKRIEVDVVILDIAMPVMNGDEALEIITRRFPTVKVIMMSMYFSDALVNEFLGRGACAYLPKDVGSDALLRALHSVAETGHYADAQTYSAMYKGLRRTQSSMYAQKHMLTEQEENILKVICQGKRAKEISVMLKIAPTTVNFHKKNITKKTKIKSIAGLVVYAIQKGIFEINEPYSRSKPV